MVPKIDVPDLFITPDVTPKINAPSKPYKTGYILKTPPNKITRPKPPERYAKAFF
jgi:hypothetical protein